MKSTGMVRKIDELGRIVLPIEIRNTMDIQKGDSLEIFVESDKIILTKYRRTCVFCDNASDDDTIYYKGKLICRDCINKLKGQF
jgi:transcriptional pleiotropic regulator of transition state genes